jgi:ribosomal protein S18 acetylase RimI-like enzyme
MQINYNLVDKVKVSDVVDLFISSGIERPVTDINRIERMFLASDIIITAYENKLLVGIARAISDFSYCTYLSDLAVHSSYQSMGIGKELISLIQKHSGDECKLILAASPEAINYYPKVGFIKADNSFFIPRLK